MSKHIIFCADGTRNSPDCDDNKDGVPDPSNVYRLFRNLQGVNTLDGNEEQERELKVGEELKQIVKYLHGIGANASKISQKVEGDVGLGIIGRIVRGYTFISRNYEAGDEISIVGFSRGAYTARALAGLIVNKGLLPKDQTEDKDKAYDRGIKVWYRYWAETSHAAISARLYEYLRHPIIFVTSSFSNDKDLVPVEHINAVGVWDTVGALGIPNEIFGGNRADHFKFADTRLNTKVQAGFHAVALDEQRQDFDPTLWDEGKDVGNVTQELFPGAHSDVGGGYAMEKGEAGLLSDITLEWMMAKLAGRGLSFAPPANMEFIPKPCVNASAHKPWKGKKYAGPRVFPSGTKENPAIAARISCGLVKADPSETGANYAPKNRPA